MQVEGLIMDLGVSERNDTAFYLAKGFRVIAVEADPGICGHLRTRFSAELASGTVKLLNFAASDTFGDSLDIFVHQVHQAVSGTAKRADVPDDYRRVQVPTIDWRTLVVQAGVPRYLKIDIEGNEASFLRGMQGAPAVPEFISVEAYRLDPIQALHGLGYQRFLLLDQNPPGGFTLPPRQFEGRTLDDFVFTHSSGPFGLDVFSQASWLDFDGICQAWQTASARMNVTWFDCHAWRPN